MAEKPTIIFMGTPEFAVPALRALHERFGVRAVVTVADKQKGRGLEVRPSDVKSAAQDLGITTILQPASLKDPEFQAQLLALQPDIICVIAFRILPKDVYSIATTGAFNVHASLLPAYRGAAPINHAILHGDRVTGVTSFLLNDVVDTGTVIMQREQIIDDGMTAGELYQALMPLAAECAVETCSMLIEGRAHPRAQDDERATPAPKVFRETSVIDWQQDVNTVRQFIHGLSPSPCAWTMWNGGTLKIYRASPSLERLAPGTWIIQGGRFVAGCKNGSLVLDEVQLPGKKRMQAADVARGYRGPTEGAFA